ncbi:MAG: flagellar biosynthesis protein FlhF [Colwellia sp.]
MKIKRFVAKDIRTALVNIKEELGEEAVIMSNKKIPEGVELMAAIDYNQDAPNKLSKHKNSQNHSSVANDSPLSITEEAEAKEALAKELMLKESIDKESKNIGVKKEDSVIQGNDSAATSQPADSLSALLKRDVQSNQNLTSSSKLEPSIQLNEEMNFDEEASIEEQLKSFTQRLRNSTPEGIIEAPTPLSTSKPLVSSDPLMQSVQNENNVGTALGGGSAQPVHHSSSPLSASSPASSSASSSVIESQELSQIKAEMASIRSLLEHQMSGLMWQNLAQKDPHRAMLNDKLIGLGLTDIIAEQISGYVTEKDNKDEAWIQALSLLSEQLNTTKNDILNRGGVVALVGPTGVGKTTTAAKLAARFSQIHGKNEVVLISTDTYRIAGFEQLTIYGEMIGCPVELAKTSDELDLLLHRYMDKKLVLIDTAGMGQRDLRLSNHLSTLVTSTMVKVRNYLVLSATSQHQVMQENVEHFKKIPLSACIYTKLDESVSIGELLSISIQNGLPLAYLTDGQKVPEDIKVANTEKLVHLADNMTNKLRSNDAVAKQARVSVPSPMVS